MSRGHNNAERKKKERAVSYKKTLEHYKNERKERREFLKARKEREEKEKM